MKEDNSTKNQKKPAGMSFGPGRSLGGSGEKAKDFKGTLKKLSAYIKPYWVSMLLVFVLSISATVFMIFSPKILGRITNTVVEDYIKIMVYDRITESLPPGQTPSTGSGQVFPKGTKFEDIAKTFPPEMQDKLTDAQKEKLQEIDLSTRPSIDFESIKTTAIILIGMYIFSFFANYLQGWVMTGISQKIAFRLRRQISEKINKLPLRYFDNQTFGDILSRITNDVDTVNQSLSQSISQLISSVTMVIGIAIMMITISWQLTIVAFIVFPVSIVVIGLVIKKSQKLFKIQQESLGEINGHIEENYSGHSIVKVFNGEKGALKKFISVNAELYDSNWKSQFLSGLLFPIISFIGNLGFVGVSVLGGWLAINQGLQIGDIQAFIQYVQQFNHPIVQLGNIVNILQSAVASAERVFEFLEEKEEIEDVVSPASMQSVKGDVDFENVEFSYEKGKPIIKRFSADLKEGQRVAIVGPTGAGKTTMVNLLMRFYDVDSGSITIDGIDIRNYRRSDLRRLFGMVLQDTWLFHGTIRENLTYGKPEATEEELRSAVDAAQVTHVIESLPEGFDFVISEDSDNVSQGEKQLLTIARAMVANPPMLILDEATSSVDTRTEVLIQKAMDNLMKGRTSFVIAHRLSTIKNADLILVMDQGNIVEQGNHEELMGKGGFYAKLYNSQFTT